MRVLFVVALMAIAAPAAEPPFYRDRANLLHYLDAGGKAQPVTTPALWQKRRAHILASLQQVMGPLPARSALPPLEVQVLEEVTLPRVIRKKITFLSEKGDRVPAYLLLPRRLEGKAAGFLCLHQTTRIGKGEPAGVGGKDSLHYALELAERGHVTLAPDYPNFGDRPLDPYALGYASATMKGIWDHMRAVDLLQSLPQVDPERIGCIGHSLGGHNALFVAVFDPRIKAVATSCGFNSFLKYSGGDLTGWSHRGYMPRIASVYGKDARRMPFDFTEILGALAPRAVFINAPLKDSNFEVSGVRSCVSAALPVYRLLGAQDRLQAQYPDAGHDFPPQVRQAAYRFLEQQLGSSPPSRPRLEVTRLVAHWHQYNDPEYLNFIAEARPEIVQVGFYGGHFWSLAHTPHGKGYPAHFPVQGLAECGQWLEKLNEEVHQRGARVVGHFNVGFLVGDPDGPEGPRGFFKFYRDLWDEKELGPRPVEDPLLLLERTADGSPRVASAYSIGGMKEYSACLNNPHWRKVLKAWTKRGLARGVDGFMINYFYRHDCVCEHCQKGFKEYLGDRLGKEQLRELGIDDLASHRFSSIAGWHDPKTSTPLKREMLRFSQISTKEAFDEVFVKYGRSLKSDLVVAQWNHLGNFSQINGDERCMLPAELWGRDEDYLWYSTGGAACFTDLEEGILGEGTLQARYIRGAFDDKPYTLGKYEQTRIRAAIAELAANGGAPMGFYTRFTDPEARKEIVRYYRFIESSKELLHANRSHAEVLLLYPRSRVHAGDVAAVERFKQVGLQLLDRHLLFDVRPDDLPLEEVAARYRKVIRVTDADAGLQALPSDLSRVDAPRTVRVSASRPATAEGLTLHFVNYNREEPAKKRSPGRGIVDEKPIAVDGVRAEVILPPGTRLLRVRATTPEEPTPVILPSEQRDGRVVFTVPRFLVYAMAHLELERTDR